jgi:hypothetical protein
VLRRSSVCRFTSSHHENLLWLAHWCKNVHNNFSSYSVETTQILEVYYWVLTQKKWNCPLNLDHSPLNFSLIQFNFNHSNKHVLSFNFATWNNIYDTSRMATLLTSLSIERVLSLPTEASLFLKVAYWYPYFSTCFCHCTVSTSYKERCRAKLKQGKQINHSSNVTEWHWEGLFVQS